MSTYSVQWDLNHLYPDGKAFDEDYALAKAQIKQLKSYDGQLSEATLFECLKLQDELQIRLGRLFAYARLQRDLNATNSQFQTLTGQVYHLMTQLGEAEAFIEPELLAMPEAKITEWLQASPDHAEYDFYLQELQRRKSHILSEKEESLLAQMMEVTQTPKDTFTMLARADMTFPDIHNEQGQALPLSEGLYSSYLTQKDRTVRQECFTNLLGTYQQYRNTFAATYNGSVKKDGFLAKARSFGSRREASLFDDHVPLTVYDQLVDTVSAGLPLLHKYVDLKKKVLGLSEIHFYDLYAPLTSQSDWKIPLTEAPAKIYDALAPLGPEYRKKLETAFHSNWIDAFEKPNKQTGAYSWGIYGVHPFILLNYHDRYQDLSTLAHELGHAMHSDFSQSTQPFRKSEYTIFTAEVASITNEMLLLNHMLQTCQDSQIQAFLLNQALESAKGTLFRQTQFAEFELAVHSKSEQGQPLTADDLEKLWLELNKKYYGSDLVLDDVLAAEWSRIPHFYNSFYVYKYATGYAAASQLAQAILTEGTASRDRYLDFLSSGGSNYPLELLKAAGVDMTSADPIQAALNQFENHLNQLQKLL